MPSPPQRKLSCFKCGKVYGSEKTQSGAQKGEVALVEPVTLEPGVSPLGGLLLRCSCGYLTAIDRGLFSSPQEPYGKATS